MRIFLSLVSLTLVELHSAKALQIPASADATVSTATTTARKNFGTSPQLTVSKNQNVYIRFDLSALPEGTTADEIRGATLRVFTEAPLSPGAVVIRSVSIAWTESTISGSNAPAAAGPAIRVEISTPKTFVDTDVTSFVQRRAGGTFPNNGLLVTPEVAGNPLKINFDSKENTAYSHPPVLELTLSKISTFRSFNFEVPASAWDAGYHYGDGNVYRGYEIPSNLTGGIDLVDFYAQGGVVLIYAATTGANGYNEVKQLPYVYSRGLNPYIGVRIEYLATRRALVISKTTNGWDSSNLAPSELPSNLYIRVVLIGKPQ